MAEEETIFDKIAKKEIPVPVVYEDDKCIAINDKFPAAPIHILLFPKNKDGLTQLSKVTIIKNTQILQAEDKHKELLGHMMVIAAKIAKEQKLDDGWRLVINDGKLGQQTVMTLHLHILGGRQFKWPPGTGEEGQEEKQK